MTSITFALFSAVLVTVFHQHSRAGECQGYCTSSKSDCYDDDGIVTGLCSLTEFCCDNSTAAKARVGSCGAYKPKGEPFLLFRSPDYPAYLHGDLLCSVTFELEDNIAGVQLQFNGFDVDGFKPGAPNDDCDQDVMYIRGFDDWVPPGICGNMVGYRMVIDDAKLKGVKNLTLLAVMSSKRYRWSIMVVQSSAKSCKNLGSSATSSQHLSSPGPLYSKDAYGDLKGADGPKSSEATRARRSLEELPLTPFVVNGEDSILGKVPWQASLRMMGLRSSPKRGKNGRQCSASEGFHTCGGSVISKREILTAAHCVYLSKKSYAVVPVRVMRIFLGDINKCEDEDDEATQAVQILKVESVTVHYNYEMHAAMNDVAIIRVQGDIKFTENVKPIKLAKTGDSFFGHDAFVSGWGRTNLRDPNNYGSDVLQYGDNLKIQDLKSCKESLKHLTHTDARDSWITSGKYSGLFHSITCTEMKMSEGKATGVGQGDSGGPLVSFDENSQEPILVGVASFLIMEDRLALKDSAHDFYQSVTYFRRWIDVTLCTLQDNEVN